MKQLGVFLPPPPPDGMLVYCRVIPSIKFTTTHLYTWVDKATVRIECPAKEHDTVSSARAQTCTTQSGGEHTNHAHLHDGKGINFVALALWLVNLPA